MRILRLPSLLCVCSLLLSGCGSSGDVIRELGLTRDPPDEFEVTTRAPLAMPPDFTLHPPVPGASRPQELPLSLQAEAALVPEAALTANDQPITKGTAALLRAAGPPAPANVRRTVDQETAQLNQAGVTDKLLFWRDNAPVDTVIDPQNERRRLNQAQPARRTAKSPVLDVTTPTRH